MLWSPFVFSWLKSDLSLTFKQAGDGKVLIINITYKNKSVKPYLLVRSLSVVGDGEQRT